MNDLAIIQKQLQTHSGITIQSLNELELYKNKFFLYRGNIVLVYIRDQYSNSKNKKHREYKYHITNCKTLLEMANNDRFDRYVISTRIDGYFLINLRDVETHKLIKKGVVEHLNVCKNCLLKLGYRGYKNHKEDKNIYHNFNFNDFLKENYTFFKQQPKYNNFNAPQDEYTKDFEQISYSFRAINDWRCSNCGIGLENNKEFLDTHHINGIKSDNNLTNLECLCVCCHANKYLHDHMKKSKKYATFINKLMKGGKTK